MEGILKLHKHTHTHSINLPHSHRSNRVSPESAVGPVEALAQSQKQQVLQAVPGHPQPFHETIVAVTHEQTKAHIGHVLPGEQQPGKAHQGGPTHHQDPHGGRVRQLGQEEASAQCCPCGVARGEGVTLLEEGGEDVRAVLSRSAASHRCLHHSDQEQVQQQSCEEEGDGGVDTVTAGARRKYQNIL